MDRPASYAKSLVSFIDIMGFKNIVENHSAAKIFEILDLIEKETMVSSGEIEIGINSFSISDCFIRTRQTGVNPGIYAPDLQSELLILTHIQHTLITKDLLVRGAIFYGDVYSEGKVIFGPAYQSAYKYESEKAVYPRIIVHDSVLDSYRGYPEKPRDLDFANARSEVYNQIRKDSKDGLWFIDYLTNIASELEDAFSYSKYLIYHRNLVSSGLIDNVRSRSFDKFKWMRRYHNLVIDELDDKWLSVIGKSKSDFYVPKVEKISTIKVKRKK